MKPPLSVPTILLAFSVSLSGCSGDEQASGDLGERGSNTSSSKSNHTIEEVVTEFFEAVLEGDADRAEAFDGSGNAYDNCFAVVRNQRDSSLFWEDFPDSYDLDVSASSDLAATVIITKKGVDRGYATPSPTLTMALENLDGGWMVDDCTP